MNMKLKNQIIAGALIILATNMLFSVIGATIVINLQNREIAFERVEKSFNVVRSALLEDQNKLLSNAIQIVASHNISDNLRYLIENKSFFTFRLQKPVYLETTKAIYNFSLRNNVCESTIYDLNGALLAFTIINTDGSHLGFVHDQETIQTTFLKPGEELRSDLWKKKNSLNNIGLTIKNIDVPEQNAVKFESIDNSLFLVSYVPIMGKTYNQKTDKMEPKQLGFLKAKRKIDNAFVIKMSELISADINIFTKEGLSIGTLPNYKKLDLTKFIEEKRQFSLQKQKVILDRVDLIDNSYDPVDLVPYLISCRNILWPASNAHAI